MQNISLGVDVTNVGTTALHPLFTRYTAGNGDEYIYIQAGAALSVGQFVAVTIAGAAALITKALADAGRKIACVETAMASADYGWVKTKGVLANAMVLASCAADVPLYTSATAGALDDTATSQTQVRGVTLTTARGGTDGVAPGVANVEMFTL